MSSHRCSGLAAVPALRCGAGICRAGQCLRSAAQARKSRTSYAVGPVASQVSAWPWPQEAGVRSCWRSQARKVTTAMTRCQASMVTVRRPGLIFGPAAQAPQTRQVR